MAPAAWRRNGLVLAVLVTVSGGCRANRRADSQAAGDTPLPNSITPAEATEGWRLLFNGHSAEGWRGFGQMAVPTGWQVVQGALTAAPGARPIMTLEQFGDFELSLEWRVKRGGAGGILYRVVERPGLTVPGESGLELPLSDTAGLQGGDSLSASGSLYGVLAAGSRPAYPAGQWNLARLLVRGNRVQHWLNGVEVLAYELGSADWQAHLRASRFAGSPAFGVARWGYICLLGGDGGIEYRSIKLREF